MHQLSWDAQGQLIEETLPDGSTFRYEYDGLGHLMRKQAPNEAIAPSSII